VWTVTVHDGEFASAAIFRLGTKDDEILAKNANRAGQIANVSGDSDRLPVAPEKLTADRPRTRVSQFFNITGWLRLCVADENPRLSRQT